eukprot:16429061-Heterocapsa_arctica.AAC.1
MSPTQKRMPSKKSSASRPTAPSWARGAAPAAAAAAGPAAPAEATGATPQGPHRKRSCANRERPGAPSREPRDAGHTCPQAQHGTHAPG